MLEIGLALVTLAALSFTIKDMAVKKLLHEKNILTTNFYVNLATFILAFLLLLISGIPPIPQSVLLPSAIVGASLALGQFFFFRALHEGRVSIVGPLSTLWAVVVILLAVLFFGKSLSLPIALGSLLAFGGILIIALIQHPKVTLNILLTILIWGLWVFASPVVETVGPIAALCLFSFFSALFSLPGAKAKNPLPFLVPGIFNFLGFAFDIAAIAVAGIVFSSSLMTPIYFLMITFGGSVFFHEKINRREALGLILVCIGIIISGAFS